MTHIQTYIIGLVGYFCKYGEKTMLSGEKTT